ncbi:hypothetical protein ACA910_013119 [Epithemia clementina (nom. ined.)]
MTYKLKSNNDAREATIRKFMESRPLQKMKYLKLSDSQKFGIELELSSEGGFTLERVADILSSDAGVGPVSVLHSYEEGRQPMSQWKIVPDSSITCSSCSPGCHKFELVSPVLQGGHGLSQVRGVLKALEQVRLQINKSMEFHVHVDVEPLSLSQSIKVCQNFVKYEDVFDSFMPPSRRTNSPESNDFFRSNRMSVGPRSPNRKRHNRISGCQSFRSLANVMNINGDKYYKLNLQNLKTGRQPTFEFRQHSATVEYAKINAWIRFFCALVGNSARLAPPRCLSSQTELNDQFDYLFSYVIKDRALRNYYRKRQQQVSSDSSSRHIGTEDWS